jgi:hypothetical protein
MPGNLGGGTGYVILLAPDSANYFVGDIKSILEGKCILQWGLISLALGSSQMYDANHNPNGIWTKVGNPQWNQISGLKLIMNCVGATSYIFWDGDFGFLNCSYTGTSEDTGSQNAYGLRELTETDEELPSDNECDLRAKALLAYLKDPAEYLRLSSTVIDYGNTPLLSGDKIRVILPNENVDSDYRIETVEYYVDGKTQTLEITLELGKEPPQLADYLYGLRATTITLEKLARTKLGKGVFPTAWSGGLGAHHQGHEAGDDNGVQWPSQDKGGWDKITGWVCPKYIGPFDDAAAIINFRTKNKAGTGVLDHEFCPSDDGHGVLGSQTNKWKEINTIYLFLPTDGYMQIRTVGESNPKAKLSKDMLQFGPGGDSALDTWLHRIAPGVFEVKSDLVPTGDNAGKIGYGGGSPLRWSELHVKDAYADNYHFTGNLIPAADNTYDLGEGVTPYRWRDIYLAGAIKALAGGCAVHFLPNSNATYDLGSGSLKWGNVYVSGVGDLGWLNVAGYTVITNARFLQNVMADTAIITSGKFILARLPNGTAGYVLEAEGSSDPMYVNPNGRYTPAAHTHSAGDIVSGVLAEARCPTVYAGHITFNGGITASDYKSSYGNSGLTTQIMYLKDLAGNTGVLTFQNGLLTGAT